jgi:hypothetical protein
MLLEAENMGWNERFERQEGSLLGYTDHENDLHIERLRASRMVKHWPWLGRLAAARNKAHSPSHASLEHTVEAKNRRPNAAGRGDGTT